MKTNIRAKHMSITEPMGNAIQDIIDNLNKYNLNIIFRDFNIEHNENHKTKKYFIEVKIKISDNKKEFVFSVEGNDFYYLTIELNNLLNNTFEKIHSKMNNKKTIKENFYKEDIVEDI